MVVVCVEKMLGTSGAKVFTYNLVDLQQCNH